MAVTNDAECFASEFPATFGDLVPCACTKLIGSLKQLTREGHKFAHDQFCNRTRVGEGGIEDGYSCIRSSNKIDLVGPNTETTNDEKLETKRMSEFQDNRPTTLDRTFEADLRTFSVIFVLLRIPMT